MLLSFAYLAVSAGFEAARSDGPSSPRTSKSCGCGTSSWSFGHQHQRPELRPAGHALIAALARLLPHRRRDGLVVTTPTLLRWHREPVRRKWTCPQRQPGRPPTRPRATGTCVSGSRARTQAERCGYQRSAGELIKLGFRLSPSTLRRLLASARARARAGARRNELAGVPSPAGREYARLRLLHRRDGHAAPPLRALLHPTRKPARARFAGCTTNPTATWVVQQARNLIFNGPFERMRFSDPRPRRQTHRLVRRGVPQLRITVMHTPLRAPQANAHAKRFVRAVGAECLDRLVIVPATSNTSCAPRP